MDLLGSFQSCTEVVSELLSDHLAEVRAPLAHDVSKADHGGVLGWRRHVLGCGGEPDDVRPVVVNIGWFQGESLSVVLIPVVVCFVGWVIAGGAS